MVKVEVVVGVHRNSCRSSKDLLFGTLSSFSSRSERSASKAGVKAARAADSQSQRALGPTGDHHQNKLVKDPVTLTESSSLLLSAATVSDWR
jgi:hypothetical protein